MDDWAGERFATYGPCWLCGGPRDALVDWEPVDGEVVVYYELTCINRRCPEPWP